MSKKTFQDKFENLVRDIAIPNANKGKGGIQVEFPEPASSNEEIERRIEEEAIRHANIVSDPEWEDFHGRELSFRLGAFWMHSLASELKAQQPVDQSLDEALSEMKKLEEKALEKYPVYGANMSGIKDIYRKEREGYMTGHSEGRAQGWRKAIEFLISTAGNYCACQWSDHLMCQKHAMTYSGGLLEEEAKRRGIL